MKADNINTQVPGTFTAPLWAFFPGADRGLMPFADLLVNLLSTISALRRR